MMMTNEGLFFVGRVGRERREKEKRDRHPRERESEMLDTIVHADHASTSLPCLFPPVWTAGAGEQQWGNPSVGVGHHTVNPVPQPSPPGAGGPPGDPGGSHQA